MKKMLSFPGAEEERGAVGDSLSSYSREEPRLGKEKEEEVVEEEKTVTNKEEVDKKEVAFL